MRKFSSRQWFLGLLLLGGATLLVRQISAQIPTVKGIGKILTVVQSVTSVLPNSFTNVVQVPPGRVLVITDLILANAGVGAASVEVFDIEPGVSTVTKLPALQLAAKANFEHLFGTGLQFAGGHDVRVFVTGAAPVDVMFSGYLRKE